MNPYDWPAISSQYGILDVCGFPKDIYYYLKSWWGKDPVVHIVPDWNRVGKEGQETKVTVYSNCEEVELLLNEKSLGKKEMPHNGHLEWTAEYQPGVLAARGYTAGKQIAESRIDSAGEAAALLLIPDRNGIKADGEDVSVITVQVTDNHGVVVPNGSSTISFSLEGPGKIIGVGNGDPSSHEPDRYGETVKTSHIEHLKELAVTDLTDRPEVAAGFDDSTWKPALQSHRSDDWRAYVDTLLVIRGTFELPDLTSETTQLSIPRALWNASRSMSMDICSHRISSGMLQTSRSGSTTPSSHAEEMNMPSWDSDSGRDNNGTNRTRIRDWSRQFLRHPSGSAACLTVSLKSSCSRQNNPVI